MTHPGLLNATALRLAILERTGARAMPDVTKAAVQHALTNITAAGVPLSDCVARISIADGRVGVAIAAPAAATPQELSAAEAEATAQLKALPGVDEVLIAVLAASDQAPTQQRPSRPTNSEARRPPQTPTRRLAGVAGMAKSGVQTLARAAGARRAGSGRADGPQTQSTPTPEIGRIIAVGSGKGGVGKSTVSLNLAVALAAMGQRVGLLDADIYGPSVPIITGALGHRPPEGGGMVPASIHGIKAMSIGFLVDPEKAVVWRAPMATGALGQLLRDTKWGTLDTLIIDMPPGTGDIQLSLSQTASLAGAVLVTTPQDLALADVRKAAAMFASVNVPIVGVVENMSTFICPHCGEATAIFGSGGGEAEAAARGVPFLGRIPLAMAVREASDAGTPVALSGGPIADAYAAVAANVVAAFAGEPERPFPKITYEES